MAELELLRSQLLDLGGLVRAVASGHRAAQPVPERADLRPVVIRGQTRLQVVRQEAVGPVTKNFAAGPDTAAALAELLALPFGNWEVETATEVIRLRWSRRGRPLLHRQNTSRRAVLPQPHDRPKEHLLDPASPVFQLLGAGADKRRQVDAFLHLLQPLLRPMEERLAERPGQPITVVDLGCGNAYLTFAAHAWLRQRHGDAVRTIGVEQRPELVEANLRHCAELGWSGLTFQTGDLGTVELEAEPDLVLALHACDTATDAAIARAVRWSRAALVAAPCCHHELNRQLRDQAGGTAPGPVGTELMLSSPALRQRLADLLTDTSRAQVLRALGYQVEVIEFIDSRHTPRNTAIRARPQSRPGRTEVIKAQLEHAELLRTWAVEPSLDRLLAAELAEDLAGA